MRIAFAAATAAVLLAAAPAALAQAGGPSRNPADSPAGVYKLDKNHASIAAKIKHLGFSNYTFLIRGLEGELTLNPKNPTASKTAIRVDPAGISTGLPDFDKEIGGKFFGGTPITFVSRTLTATGPSAGRLVGDLTLNGVTKPVTLNVVFNGGGPQFRSNRPTLGFSATGMVKRSDFNITPQMPAAVLGDEVELEIEAEFNQDLPKKG
jgi:polyisoprenoid-binding protein YceI